MDTTDVICKDIKYFWRGAHHKRKDNLTWWPRSYILIMIRVGLGRAESWMCYLSLVGSVFFFFFKTICICMCKYIYARDQNHKNTNLRLQYWSDWVLTACLILKESHLYLHSRKPCSVNVAMSRVPHALWENSGSLE